MNLSLPDNFVFSQSNLQTYQKCPHKFMLAYIQKLSWPAQITTDLNRFEQDRASGSMFHNLLQKYFIGLDLETLLKIAKNDPDQRIQSWFKAFLQSPLSKPSGKIFPEFIQFVSIDGTNLMAKFDLIELENNRLTIYDWKTSEKPADSKKIWQSIQTRVYSLVAFKAFANPGSIQANFSIGMQYWEANFPSHQAKKVFTIEELQANQIYLLDLCSEIRSKSEDDFIKTSDLKICQYCQFRSLCDRGTKAGEYELYAKEFSMYDLDWKNPADGLV